MHKKSIFRLLWCLFGAAVGLGLALSLAGPQMGPFLLTSLGGTAIFLFGLTRAPAAQPRALFGGHLGGGGHWDRLLSGVWRCTVGLCSYAGSIDGVHACHSNHSSSSWSQSNPYGLCTCWMVRALAAGIARDSIFGDCRHCLESNLPWPLSIPSLSV